MILWNVSHEKQKFFLQLWSRHFILPSCSLHMESENMVYICFLKAFWWLLNDWTSYKHPDISYATYLNTQALNCRDCLWLCFPGAPAQTARCPFCDGTLQFKDSVVWCLWFHLFVLFWVSFALLFLFCFVCVCVVFLPGFTCLPKNNLIYHLTSKILSAHLNLIFDILNKSVTCISKHSGILPVALRTCFFFYLHVLICLDLEWV